MVIYRLAVKAIIIVLIVAALICFTIMATDERFCQEFSDATERVAAAVQKNDRAALLKVIALPDQADELLEWKDDLKGGYSVSVYRKEDGWITLLDVTGRSYRSRIQIKAPPAALEFECNRWTTRPVLVKRSLRPEEMKNFGNARPLN